MQEFLLYLSSQIVTVIVSSVTSAITVLFLLSRVFTRLTTVENSLLGSKSAEEQVTILRASMTQQLTQMRADMTKHEADDKVRLDRIDAQYGAIVEGWAKAGESLEWIKKTLSQDRKELIERIKEHEARNDQSVHEIKEQLAALNALQQQEPPRRTRRKSS